MTDAGIGESTLAIHPDMYERIPDFINLAATFGLYIEFTAYIGADGANDDYDPDHWNKLGEAVKKAKTLPLLELINENDAHAVKLDTNAFSKIDNILCSHGSNGSQAVPVQPFWDYATFHTNGAFEEQRKVGHNAMELSDTTPVLTNETSRYPDVGMWASGNIDRQKQLAFDSAAGASLLCAGSCFHCVSGKSSVLMNDDEVAVAMAWVNGAKSINTSCQIGSYNHRSDLDEGSGSTSILRAYQRGTDSNCIVLIRA